MHEKKIVILGAGFGGLRAALLVSRGLESLKLQKTYDVVLVDRNEHHIYTPLLYEVATTSKRTANIAKLHHVTTHSIWSLLENRPTIFLHEEVAGVDVGADSVRFRDGQQARYDHLVIALGAETNHFGIPGLKEHSLSLKSFKDAIKIRDSVWNLAMGKKERIDIIVGGGGSTGVELAAEFMSWCGELSREFPACRLSVKIVEAGPTVLGGFPEKIIRLVEERLRSIGVEIVANSRIARTEKAAVFLGDKRKIGFDLLVWTGGIKAPSVLNGAQLKFDSRGQLAVRENMECFPQNPDVKLRSPVYALGDSVCLYDPKTGKPIPAVARAAIEQADIVAHNLLEDVKREAGISKAARHKSFEPWGYPYITPVGGKYAVAKVGSFVTAGTLGWFLKGLVELYYLLSIMSPLRAIRTWIKGLIIFIQNDRLG